MEISIRSLLAVVVAKRDKSWGRFKNLRRLASSIGFVRLALIAIQIFFYRHYYHLGALDIESSSALHHEIHEPVIQFRLEFDLNLRHDRQFALEILIVEFPRDVLESRIHIVPGFILPGFSLKASLIKSSPKSSPALPVAA